MINLNQKGFKVKTKKNLFNLSGYKVYTLEEALDYALKDKTLKNVKIPKELYKHLVEDLVSYKNNKYRACHTINIKYGFSKDDSTRFAFQKLIERLYERGFDFMSDKKTRIKLKKAVK